ncbi:MAG: c-type cytochrome domain-containing protein [Bacteroidota bacterium]
MRSPGFCCFLFAIITLTISSCSEKKLSFSQEVFPLLKKRCVGCHYPGNEFNQSRLAMESYESLLKGGVHGSPVVAGHADSSLIIKKLSPNPPFGDQMPLMSKQKLTAEEVVLIGKWIDQGANNN